MNRYLDISDVLWHVDRMGSPSNQGTHLSTTEKMLHFSFDCWTILLADMIYKIFATFCVCKLKT